MSTKRQSKLFERLLDSDIKADLLIFFHNHPDVNDTVDGLAKRINRDPADIRRAVADLEELGLVRKTETYGFNERKDVQLQENIFKELAVAGSTEETVPVGDRELVKIGIPVLDELLPDGILAGTAILLLADPGAGREVMNAQLVSEAIKRGDPALFVALDNFPESIRTSINDLIGKHEGRKGVLTFIDCYSKTVGLEGHEAYSLDPDNLSEVSMALSTVLQRQNSKLLVLDSLSTLIRKRQVRSSLEFLHVVVAKARQAGTLCLVTMNRKAFHPAIIAAAQEIVDGVLEMKIEEENGSLVRYLRVLKMHGSRLNSSWVPIEVDDLHGIKAAATKTTTPQPEL